MKDTTDQTTTGILIVDNDPLILSTFTRLLTPCGYVIKTLTDPRQTLSLLDDASIHLVITDIVMPHVDGLELCQLIKEKRPDIEVIVVTGAGSIEVAVQAMKAGAYDFLTKPLESVDRIRAQIAKAIEHSKLSSRNQYLEREVGIARRFNTIVGNSTLMHKVFQLIEAVAPTNSSVLIIGETGTGKELVARAIHEKSKRRERIFLPLNCAALTENLLEAELFGHTKGAFTGAISNRKGLIEEANGGTLFLDELGEMPLSTQAKLLRVLEQGDLQTLPFSSSERLALARTWLHEPFMKRASAANESFYHLTALHLPKIY
jgi:two-component system response regulator HydG